MKKTEGFRNYFKTLKLWTKISPNYLIYIVLDNLLLAITPLIPIFIVGKLVEELSTNRDIVLVRKLVGILLIAVFLLGLINKLIRRKLRLEWHMSIENRDKMEMDKFLDMDYELVANGSSREIYSQIVQNRRWMGYGLDKAIESLEKFLEGSFMLIGSLALSFNVFLVKPSKGGVGSHIFNGIFLGIIILISYLSPKLYNRGMGYWTLGQDEARLGNRIFSFYGYSLFEDNTRATDARIYRQADYAVDKLSGNGVFGRGGFFSKLAKGKMGLYIGTSEAISSMILGIVILFVAVKAKMGALSLGQVTIYVGSLINLVMGIGIILKAIGDIRTNDQFLKESLSFLEIENVKYRGSLSVEKRQDRKYDIEFEDVWFKYPESESYALEGVNLKFEIGERMALVGENGSGKSTLIKLLCRLYDVDRGRILLNGIDIKKYNYNEYMAIFSVVFQDFKLLSLPLGENISTGSQYDQTRVFEVLEEVGLNLEKENFKEGLETYLYRDIKEGGIEISGGEAQKVAIARAIYNDSPFVVLDEPTASLDPIAEAEIYEHFNKIIKDKTAIFISHRLSSCKFADRILVLDKGRLIEEGRHSNLVKDHSSKYYELWQAQAQYYNN